MLPKLKLRKPHDLIRSSGTVESRTRKRPAFCVSSIFGGAFLLYSQALICHFNAPWILGLRGAIAVLGYAAIAVAVLGAGSLRYELFLSDITCGLLLVAAMISIRFRLRAPVDKALFAASEGLIRLTVRVPGAKRLSVGRDCGCAGSDAAVGTAGAAQRA